MPKKSTAVAAAAGTGIVGYVIGKLSVADVKQLAVAFINGLFQFLREQGQYAAFTLIVGAAFVGIAIWSIKKLINGKDEEIERLVSERDQLQQLFINDWKSSRGGKKK